MFPQRRGLGQFRCERGGFFDPLVERHDRLEGPLCGVFQQPGLQQREAPAPYGVLGCPDRVADTSVARTPCAGTGERAGNFTHVRMRDCAST